MKKILLIAAVVLAATSCETREDRTTNEPSGDAWIRFYRDPATGVQYVLYAGKAITPRLNPDGTLYVGKD